jgi:putative inorganic carbon (HCO3(-)) transporter
MATLRMKIREFAQLDQRSILFVAMLLCSLVLIGGLVTLEGILTLAVVITVGLTLAMIAWPESATLVFIFILYINLPVVLTNFHKVPQIFAAASVLILLIPLASYIFLHRKPLIFTPALPILVIYFVVMLVSAIFNDSVNDSMDVFITYLTEGILLYFLVTNVVRTPETLRRVVWILILAGSFMGAISIFQEATHTYTNNYWGFAQVDKGGFSVSESLAGKVYRLRLAGPIGEKNRYAQIMLAIFPLALMRIGGEKKLVLKILAAAGTLLILSGCLLTFSRGAAVAMVGLLVITTIWGYIKPHQTILVLITLAALIAVVAPDFVVRLDSLKGISGIFTDDGENPDGAIVGRETSNLAAYYAFLDHPILGVGPGEYYKQYSAQYANELGLRFFAVNRRAHNMYLETAADLGLVGLAVLLGIFAATMTQLEKMRRYWSRRQHASANMVTAFLLSMISYMATAVFLHLSYLRYLTLILALANAAIYISQSETLAEKMPVEADTSKTTFDPLVPAPQYAQTVHTSGIGINQGAE